MPDTRDLKQVLRALSPEDLHKVGKEVGWYGVDPILGLMHGAQDPAARRHWENSIIRAVFNATNIEVMTEDERAEYYNRIAAEANVGAAEFASLSVKAAERAAVAAEKSAEEASKANVTAEKAHTTARYNTIWSFGAFGVALVALLLSVLRSCIDENGSTPQ
jgi:hypothetical protein